MVVSKHFSSLGCGLQLDLPCHRHPTDSSWYECSGKGTQCAPPEEACGSSAPSAHSRDNRHWRQQRRGKGQRRFIGMLVDNSVKDVQCAVALSCFGVLRKVKPTQLVVMGIEEHTRWRSSSTALLNVSITSSPSSMAIIEFNDTHQ